MLRVSRTSVAVLGCSLAFVLLSACGGTTSGDPSPGADTSVDAGDSVSSTVTPSQGDSTDSSSGDAVAILKSDDPCSILTNNELDSLGLTASGEKTKTGRSQGCTWTQNGSSLRVAIRSKQGLGDFAISEAKGLKSLSIGDHNAKQLITPGTEICVVGIGLSDHSRVDVSVAMANTDEECSAAEQSAKVVEPHLPPEG